MSNIVFFIGFLVITFCVMSLLSAIAMTKKETFKSEELVVKSVDKDMISIIKDQYLKFLNAIINKDLDTLKAICSKNFLSQFDLNKSNALKVVLIIESKVLAITKKTIEIEFFSRSIYSDLLYNKCIFKVSGKNFIIDNLQ